MNEINLIPTDPLTQRLLVDVLTKMFKHELMTRMAASPESSTVGVTAASVQPTQTDEPKGLVAENNRFNGSKDSQLTYDPLFEDKEDEPVVELGT